MNVESVIDELAALLVNDLNISFSLLLDYAELVYEFLYFVGPGVFRLLALLLN